METLVSGEEVGGRPAVPGAVVVSGVWVGVVCCGVAMALVPVARAGVVVVGAVQVVLVAYAVGVGVLIARRAGRALAQCVGVWLLVMFASVVLSPGLAMGLSEVVFGRSGGFSFPTAGEVVGLTVGVLVVLGTSIAAGIVLLLYGEELAGRGGRRPRHICVGCGYDMRATPDAEEVLERCPECGRGG